MLKISLVIPIYNVEKYISKCLDSVINQTYKNIEVICINDGSTDNSLQILEQYAQKDKRIKVINQKNQGVSVARNIGIKESSGDYILFVDADDWIELSTCEILTKTLEQNNIDIIYFNNYYVCEKKIQNINRLKQYKKEKQFINKLFWAALYNKNFLEKNNILFPIGLPTSEDFFFSCLVYIAQPRIYFIDDYLYFYRNTSNSATKKWNSRLHTDITAFDTFKSLKIYKNLSYNEQLFIIDDWAKVLFSCWSSLTNKNFQAEYNKLLKSFLENYKQFKYEDYKNLVGYKRIKNKYIIKFLKKIRDIYFNIIYRVNNNAK